MNAQAAGAGWESGCRRQVRRSWVGPGLGQPPSLSAVSHKDASRVVDSVKIHIAASLTEILIYRLSCPLPMAVIVNDQNALGIDQRVQMLQLMPG